MPQRPSTNPRVAAADNQSAALPLSGYPPEAAASRALTAAFFADPPFADGHYGPRMGLAPLAPGAWLPYAPSTAEQQRKRRLFEGAPTEVYGALPEPAPAPAAEALVLDQVTAAAPASPATASWAAGWPSLMQAALRVPDDLLLLWRPETAPSDEYRLLAASLCSPSYWRLGDKLGQPLSAIHAPVSGLPAALLQRMTQFLRQLPADRLFERRNWSVHLSAQRFQPEPVSERRRAAAGWPEGLADWWIRSERQTLRRLDATLILFTIRVDLHPLAALPGFLPAHSAFTAALAALEGVTLAEFGGPAKVAAIKAALQAG